jgi:hypothetical protein
VPDFGGVLVAWNPRHLQRKLAVVLPMDILGPLMEAAKKLKG